MAKQKTSRSERFFRRLLRLFPFDFRWEHGREMEQDFRTRSREEKRNGGGAMGIFRLWWETLSDIARPAPREHFDMLRQDVGYALRTMGKNPGFTIIAVLTLALGIGANTAILSVVNAVLFRPLPFQRPDQLVFLQETARRETVETRPLSYPNFLDWQEQNKSFGQMAAWDQITLSLSGEEEAERITGEAVSAGTLWSFGTISRRSNY